jgi:hypothetical protein
MLGQRKRVAHMPIAEQQKNKFCEPRFKIDHVASPMPETTQPERLAPRATSNRNGGRDHLGILGEIKSEHRARSSESAHQTKSSRLSPIGPSPGLFSLR